MHPLNNNFFGNTANTSIKVHFNMGNGVQTGYIWKQPSVNFWRVANAGTSNSALVDSNTYLCQLVPNAPASGQFAIYAYPVQGGVANTNAMIYVNNIDAHHVYDVNNNKYIWTINQPLPTTTGYVKLDTN